MSSFKISFLIYDDGNIIIELHIPFLHLNSLQVHTTTTLTTYDFLRGIFIITSLTMTIITSLIRAYFQLLALNT
jgi:hypothetical protein